MFRKSFVCGIEVKSVFSEQVLTKHLFSQFSDSFYLEK